MIIIKNKGITLIALVITIIIMIFLAGVAIQLAIGDNGLILKSNKARLEQAKSELIDGSKIQIATYYIDKKLKDENSNTIEKLYNSKWFLDRYEIRDGNIYDKTIKEDIIMKEDFEKILKNENIQSLTPPPITTPDESSLDTPTPTPTPTPVPEPDLVQMEELTVYSVNSNDNIVKGTGYPYANIKIEIGTNRYYTTVEHDGTWKSEIPKQNVGTNIIVKQEYYRWESSKSTTVIKGHLEVTGDIDEIEDDEGPHTIITP